MSRDTEAKMRTVSLGDTEGTQPPRDGPVCSLPKQRLHFFQDFFPPSLSSFSAFSSFYFLLQILTRAHYVPATVLGTAETHLSLPVQSYREMGEEDKERLAVNGQLQRGRAVEGKFREHRAEREAPLCAGRGQGGVPDVSADEAIMIPPIRGRSLFLHLLKRNLAT